MRIGDFDLYRDLMKQQTGLNLPDEKSSLVEARLTPIAHKWNYPTIESLTLALRGMPNQHLLQEVLEALIEHETAFFRDSPAFEVFQNMIMPYLITQRRKQRLIRIWCAGCATGQEPYSLAIILKEITRQIAGWQTDIVATDISHKVIAQAQKGFYTPSEMQHGLSLSRRLAHFDQAGLGWKLKDDVRRMVTFKPFNLLNSPETMGVFDVIFCRNVLTGFDTPTRRKVLENLSGCLAADGFLVLDSSETLTGDTETLRPLENHQALYSVVGGKHRLTEPAERFI